MTQINSRIKQKYDILSNWTSNNIVLLNGELAVVDCGDCIKFKVGNGLSTFNQLPFADQNMLSTKTVVANAILQGVHTQSAPYGLAAGAYSDAGASFSQAFGYNATVLSTDSYAFAWNGDNTRLIGDSYDSHGKGTFSLNPLSGVNGMFIGEQSLGQLFDQRQLSGDYLSSNALDDYKTYNSTLSSLSSDGYVMSASIASTLGSIQKSAFDAISSPQASVRSIQQTLTQILEILRGQENNNG